jgi:hypothetical protein
MPLYKELSPSTTNWRITEEERKRRERVIEDAVASCAIEGLQLTPKDLQEVRQIAMIYETSDEMVAELRRRMQTYD